LENRLTSNRGHFRGAGHWQPKRDGERNEALDTFVYAHAALHGLISMGLRLNEEVEGMNGKVTMPTHSVRMVIRSTWMA
jgi:phage terminase large subunit GpA-like protein